MLFPRAAIACGVLAMTLARSTYGQASWQIALSRDASNKITRTGPDPASAVSDQTIAIEITCQNVDCRQVEGRVTLGDGKDLLGHALTPTNRTATGVTITLTRVDARPVGDQQRFLELSVKDTMVGDPFPLKVGQPSAPAASARTVPLSELVTASCVPPPVGRRYDKKAGAAYFLVTPLGQVLARPGDIIDENDSVVVEVSGAEQLLPRLTVKRSSEFGASGGIRIVGAEIRIQELPGLRRQAAGQPPPCDRRTVTLHDFAPGRGEVQISVRTDEGEEQLGKFEFGVNPLYTGAFSFGIVRSSLADPTFGLLFNGTDSIITETDNPSRKEDDATQEEGTFKRQRILYGVFYTPFFGRLDVEKERLILRPTIGFALNDISDNVFVGGALLVQGSFSLMVGVHWGKVTRLDPRSSLDVGSVFDGATNEIPTVRRWRGDAFLGISLDVRATAQFLRVAFGAAGGG